MLRRLASICRQKQRIRDRERHPLELIIVAIESRPARFRQIINRDLQLAKCFHAVNAVTSEKDGLHPDILGNRNERFIRKDAFIVGFHCAPYKWQRAPPLRWFVEEELAGRDYDQAPLGRFGRCGVD